MSQSEIWVFSESGQMRSELLAGARTLAEKTGGIVRAMVIGDTQAAEECVACGAAEVFLIPPVPALPLEGYAPPLVQLLDAHRPRLLLMGATNRGKGLAAMLAAALDTGCSTEAREVTVGSGGEILVSRLIYGGIGVATETCNTSPYIVTVPLRTFDAPAAHEAREGTITAVPFDHSEYAARVLELQAKPADSVDLGAAKIVVAFGRGVAKREDIELLQSLAEALGGVLACTRPIAEDYHWMPKDRYVGLSGKSVKPGLYVVIGSSGQIQHLAGAHDAKIIFAVNTDARAPVFEAADYGIVADLYQVVPALLSEVRRLKA